jgi:hypothetical protein
MPRYKFNYYVEDYGTVSFDAENMEQAEQLFNQVVEGEKDYEELPNYSKKWRGGDMRHDELKPVEQLPAIPILGLKTGGMQ